MDARRTQRARAIASLALAVALTGCKLATVLPSATQGLVDASRATVHVGNQDFVLRSANGEAIGKLALQVDGKLLTTTNGNFEIPADVLAAAKKAGHAGVWVLATGFLPQQLDLADAGSQLTLVPVTTVATRVGLSSSTVTLSSGDGSVSVTLPGGFLKAAPENVAVATYLPPVGAADTAAENAERTAFLAALGGASSACNAPLPCPPAISGLGVLLTVDGPVAPGTVTSSFDLNAPEYTGNPAAQAILASFQRIDALPNGASYRALLASKYGITLAGSQLTFMVAVGPNAITDGLARIEVDGLPLLGGKVELTVVSASGSQLPAAASEPSLVALVNGGGAGGDTQPASPGVGGLVSGGGTGNLGSGLGHVDVANDGSGLISQGAGGLISQGGNGIISQDGNGIISQDGNGLISQDGNGLISQDGNGLKGGSSASLTGGHSANSVISNDGGSLTGTVRVPFTEPDPGKFKLLGFTDYIWSGGSIQVSATTHDGVPVWVSTDSSGHFTINNLPPTRSYLILLAKAGNLQLTSIVAPPGQSTVDTLVDAATTGMTALALGGVSVANLTGLDLTKLPNDVSYLHGNFHQNNAQDAVSKPMAEVAGIARGVFRAGDTAPQSLPYLMSTLAGDPAGIVAGSTDGAGAVARFYMPDGIVCDGHTGTVYVDDSANHEIRAIATDGTTTTLAGSPLRPSPIDGPLATAGFGDPRGLTLSSDGKTLYFTEREAGQVRALDMTAGTVTTIAGPTAGGTGYAEGNGTAASFNLPSDIKLLNGNTLLVADRGNDLLRKVTLSGVTSLFAGVAGSEALTDGPLGTGKLSDAVNIAVDGAGNTYVANFDASQAVIRKVDASGVITTLAGGPTGCVNGIGPVARFEQPNGLVVDDQGKFLYICDEAASMIRQLDLATMEVTTVGGLPNTKGSVDGEPGVSVLNTPTGIAFDSGQHCLYINDYGAHNVRRMEIP